MSMTSILRPSLNLQWSSSPSPRCSHPQSPTRSCCRLKRFFRMRIDFKIPNGFFLTKVRNVPEGIFYVFDVLFAVLLRPIFVEVVRDLERLLRIQVLSVISPLNFKIIISRPRNFMSIFEPKYVIFM